MKRLLPGAALFALALVLFITSPVHAWNVLMGPTRPQATNVMLNAVTATGTGTAADKFACTMTWAGTAPSNVVWALMGSIDGVNYVPLYTQTSTASPDYFFVYFRPARWILGDYVSNSGADETTAISVTCFAGGL